MPHLGQLFLSVGPGMLFAGISLYAFLESFALIGLALPGTTLILFFGYLVSVDKLDFWLVIFSVAAGGSLGDITSFYLGRNGLRYVPFLQKRIGEKNIVAAEKFFSKYGSAGVVLQRFIGPLRPIFPFVAGLLKMRRAVFVPIDIISNVLSSYIFISFGLLAGDRIRDVVLVSRAESIFAFGVVLIILAYYYFKK